MLFPGFFIWCMGFRLFTWPETDNRDAVTAHDGNAVGGEGPFIDHRRFTEQPFISVAERAYGEMILFNFPGREVAFRWINQPGP